MAKNKTKFKMLIIKLLLKWFAKDMLEFLLESMTEKGLRDFIHKILLKHFVPMDKQTRHRWESLLIYDKYFPYRDLIVDIWHTEIKSKYPNIGEWHNSQRLITKTQEQ